MPALSADYTPFSKRPRDGRNSLANFKLRTKLAAGSDFHRVMQNIVTIALSRDCEAVQIPQGATVVLPKGLSVDITQTLGGSYTIHAQGGLYRVSEKDADALGVESKPKETERSAPAQPVEVEEKQVWDVLRTCFDPEIPVNIVDLGLVYDLNIEKLPSGFRQVNVKMTLTAQGCGMGPTLARDAQQKLMYLDGVEEANVEIVWDPPWHQSMITEAGRKILGIE